MEILFVCTGNTCRSPMAEAMLNKLVMENELDIHATSAGIFAEYGHTASKNAILAMKNRGIDLKGHRTRPISDELINNSDLIITMTAAHKILFSEIANDKTFTMYEFIGKSGDISDPYGGDLDEYEKTADEIYECLVEILEKIVDDIK